MRAFRSNPTARSHCRRSPSQRSGSSRCHLRARRPGRRLLCRPAQASPTSRTLGSDARRRVVRLAVTRRCCRRCLGRLAATRPATVTAHGGDAPTRPPTATHTGTAAERRFFFGAFRRSHRAVGALRIAAPQAESERARAHVLVSRPRCKEKLGRGRAEAPWRARGLAAAPDLDGRQTC